MRRFTTLLAATLTAMVSAIPTAFAACHVAMFSTDKYEISEKGGKVVIGVQNPGPAEGDRTVDWETVNGTAKAGTDFAGASGTLSFTPQETSHVIEVAISNDQKHENEEQFTVRLKARPGSCISQDSIGPPATVTITDDDPKSIAIPTTTPTKTKAPTPSPTSRQSSPAPTPRPTSRPSSTASPSPSPSPTVSPVAAPDVASDGGLSGGALAGIVLGVVVLGGCAAIWVRLRFLV
jgi:hypothetical protein